MDYCFRIVTLMNFCGTLVVYAIVSAKVRRTSAQGTCPAVKAPNSKIFVKYDWRYQAATLEEAVANFIDPTAIDPLQAQTMYGTRPNAWVRQRCLTFECLSCLDQLSERLRPLLSDVAPVTTSLFDKNRPRKCKVFSTPTPISAKPRPIAAPSVDEINRLTALLTKPLNFISSTSTSPDSSNNTSNVASGASRFVIPPLIPSISLQQSSKSEQTTKESSNSSSNRTVVEKSSLSSSGSLNSRPKRETSSKLGHVENIACNYKRGEPLTEKAQMTGLCNLCWSIRILPVQYFPRFINELSCDSQASGNTTCLSGFGACSERMHAVDVLYNSAGSTDKANPNWSHQSVAISVACECQVYMSAALYNIVKN